MATTDDARRRSRRRRLRNLKVDEIGLVDAGANPGARVLLFKRQEGSEMDHTKRDVELLIERLADEAVQADRTGWLRQLTREQRFVKVLEDRPDLYEAYEAARPKAVEPPKAEPLHKAGSAKARAWENVQAMAGEILAEEPELSEAAAITKALERNPELYTEYLAAG